MIPSSGLSVARRVLRKARTEIARRTVGSPARWPPGRRVVSITFDDFPVSAATTGAAILESHDSRGTFYAALSLAGGPSASGPIADRDHIANLGDRGHEIGCHTFRHIDCSIESATAVHTDCGMNRRRAEELGLRRASSFAFPYGRLNRESRSVIARQYTSARTVWPGINRGRFDLAALRAVPMMERDGVAIALDHLRALSADHGWLIFYGHDVERRPSPFGCTPEFLDDLCARIRGHGIEIQPVGMVRQSLP